MKPNQPDTVGAVLKDILRRLKAVETSPQLTAASIKDGRLRILDENFDQRAQFGRLDDGDVDGDGDQDWGLVIFDESGDWAFLGTKAGVFVRGKIQGGTIDIGGSDASSFHVDTDGNLWLGAALFASAPFRVAANGDLTVEGATITAGTFRTAASGQRVEIEEGASDRIQLFSGNPGESVPGYVGVDSTGKLIAFGPTIGGVDSGFVWLEPGLATMKGDRASVQADNDIFFIAPGGVEVNVGDFNVSIGEYQLAGHPAWKGGREDAATNAAGDITIPHGLGAQPAGVSATMDAASGTTAPYRALVQNVDPTNMTVRIFDAATGAAVGSGVSVSVWWTVLS